MKHIKFVETPLRDSLAGIREPHQEILDQMIHSATYTAHMLDSAAGFTTSPPPSASASSHPASMPMSYNRVSSPREPNNRVEDTQSSHTHDNSPPLPASAATKRVGDMLFLVVSFLFGVRHAMDASEISNHASMPTSMEAPPSIAPSR